MKKPGRTGLFHGWASKARQVINQPFTSSWLSTDVTPCTPLAISSARALAAAVGAGPFRLTAPPLVSTLILIALRSGSLARPADTEAVMAASFTVALTAEPASLAASFTSAVVLDDSI